MNRDHTAPFSKQGPRAARIARREVEAIVEQECEHYVREKMKPGLVTAAKQAVAGFSKQNGR